MENRVRKATLRKVIISDTDMTDLHQRTSEMRREQIDYTSFMDEFARKQIEQAALRTKKLNISKRYLKIHLPSRHLRRKILWHLQKDVGRTQPPIPLREPPSEEMWKSFGFSEEDLMFRYRQTK